MSADVHSRRHREKKRKKDEDDNVPPAPTPTSGNETIADNATIHIYKESNTGGHWCARIIFFLILAVLASLIGIVILEHRGTTDINIPLESSRWATIFDGWVDDPLHFSNEEPYDDSKHEETQETEEQTNDELEEQEEEEEEGDQDEETAENEAVDEEAISEEHDDEEDTEDHDRDEEPIQDESNEAEEEDEEDQIYQSNEEGGSQEAEGENDPEEEHTLLENEIIDSEDEDDAEVLEEVYATGNDNDSDEKTTVYEEDDQSDEIVEIPTSEEVYEKYLDIPGINDDNIEPLEEVEGIEPEEYVNEAYVKPEVEEDKEEPASVAMKLGVGVALVVAAHFVLIKRWDHASVDSNSRPKIKLINDKNDTNVFDYNTSNVKSIPIHKQPDDQKYKEFSN